MTASPVANFLRMLAAGRDSALLRYSLGNEYLKAGETSAAIPHLAHAIHLDPRYSAAWKLYGKALEAAGRMDEAANAYDKGIAAARERGDMQAAREMSVFLKRVRKVQGIA